MSCWKRSTHHFIHAFSLVELLVGIVLASILLLGAMSVAANTTVAYLRQAEYIKMNERARFVFDYIGHRVRESGYWGCIKSLAEINNVSNETISSEISGTSDSTETSEPIDNSDLTNTDESTDITDLVDTGDSTDPVDLTHNNESTDTAGLTDTSESIDTADLTDNNESTDTRYKTDQMTLFGAETLGKPIRIDATQTSTDTISVNDASNFSDNETVLIADCSNGDIATISSIAGNDIKFTADLNTLYDTNAFIYPVERRQIKIDSTGLVENSTQFTTDTLLVENIERLNLLYGIDTNADGVANQYVNADKIGSNSDTPVGDWDDVISIRVNIVVRSDLPNMVPTPMEYTFGDTTFNPTDRHFYQVYSTTILRRNEV